MRVVTIVGRACLAAFTLLVASGPAFAQSPWSVEANAGVMWTGNSVTGTGSLPTTGQLFQGTMSVSTLFFGDGTQLFDQNQTAIFGTRAVAIASLDQMLTSSPLERDRGPEIGVRLQRDLTSRLAIEIGGDLLWSRVSFTPGALAAIEASRSSYATAVAQALSATQLPVSPSSVATVTDRQAGMQLIGTANLVFRLLNSGRVVPYIAAGGGVVSNNDTLPSAKLVGHYEVGDPSQLFGTDTVAVKFSEESLRPLFSAGAGVEYSIASKWAIRAGMRLRMYRNFVSSLVDVTPQTAARSTGQPFPFITVGSLPVAPTSLLNAAPISEVTTFTPGGQQSQVGAFVGLVRRF